MKVDGGIMVQLCKLFIFIAHKEYENKQIYVAWRIHFCFTWAFYSKRHINDHSFRTPGGTQLWVEYGCAARSFDHHPITKPEKTQICNLYLNHLFLEGPFLKPISTFCHVNWDAKVLFDNL